MSDRVSVTFDVTDVLPLLIYFQERSGSPHASGFVSEETSGEGTRKKKKKKQSQSSTAKTVTAAIERNVVTLIVIRSDFLVMITKNDSFTYSCYNGQLHVFANICLKSGTLEID